MTAKIVMEPALAKATAFFIPGRELAVEIARVTSVGRDLFHRDGDLFERVGKIRHIRQKDQDAFAPQRELFGDR